MSDETPAPKKPRTTKPSTTPFERAVTGDAPADAAAADAAVAAPPPVEPARVEPVESATPVAEPTPTPDPTPASTVGAQPQVIYVSQPAPPARKGNRGFGVLIALLSTVAFALVFAVVGALIGLVANGVLSFDFLANARFWIPVLLFAVGFILLVLIVNRAGWWTYIIGSILVGLFVYFGTVGIRMLADGVIQDPAAAADLFVLQLLNPSTIVAGLLAREISMWAGVSISRRGRIVKGRNADARAAYERDLDEKKAERDRLVGESA